MTDRTLVVADDLTGATDTGHGFAARGFETVVRLDPDFESPDAAVLVVDTDSRYVAPNEAASRVATVISDIDAATVYKKVDSTLRGNLAAEIEAAMAAMDADAAAVAPAFPSNGRVTACGYHLTEGVLVTDTEAGNDPDSPVHSPRLPDHLRQQGASDVSHAGIEVVGTNDVPAALDDGRLVTFDAVHDVHLDAIASGCDDANGNVLLVGSGGLAEHVHVRATPTADRTSLAENPSGTAFGVSGSVNERTLAQLDALPADRVVHLDAVRAVHDVEAAVRAAAVSCTDRLADEETVVLTSACDPADVDMVLGAAAEAGVSDREARERVTEALATATESVWTEHAPDGLFLTGGAVTKGVLGELDARGIALRGEEVTSGVPVGEVRGGLADGTPLVTKAGAFGEDGTISDALDHLRRVPM